MRNDKAYITMTDKEFLTGLGNLTKVTSPELAKEFYKKAEELVERPPTKIHQRAYLRLISLRKGYDKSLYERIKSKKVLEIEREMGPKRMRRKGREYKAL